MSAASLSIALVFIYEGTLCHNREVRRLNTCYHEGLKYCVRFYVMSGGQCERTEPIFQNLKRFEGRKSIVEQLAALGLLRGKQNHTMQVPFCSRSGDVVELLVKPQW
jgi:valyl-tRNA synthetase